MKIILTLVLTIILINANLVNAAGFDCTKASTNIEKMICSNETLSKLDDQNTQLFKQYKSVSNDLNLIVQDQRDWLKHTRNSCQDASCLEAEYEKRNTYLSSRIESNQGANTTDSISDNQSTKNEPLVGIKQMNDGVEAQASGAMTISDGLEVTEPVMQQDLPKIEEGKFSSASQISEPTLDSELHTQEASKPSSFKAQYAHVFSGLLILLVFVLGVSFPAVMRKVF